MPADKLEELFRNHFRSAVFVAEMVVKSRETAEDIVQDVFIKLLDKDLDTVSSPVSYLYTSVRNSAVDHVRSRALVTGERLDKELIPDSSSLDVTSGDIEYANRIRRLFNAIEKLPERSRTIVQMICMEQNSYLETADKLGISVSTVKTHMYRSFKFLRKHLSFLFW